MKYLLAVVALLILAGCSSDVDKCVKAGMKSEIDPSEKLSKQGMAMLESQWRIICLRAKSGG